LSRFAQVILFLGLGLAAATVVRADWTATGTVLYRDRAFDPTGFTGAEPLVSARFSDVEVVDAGNGSIVARGATDASGAFSVYVVDGSTRNIYVRALTRSSMTPGLFVTVANAAWVPYAIASPTIVGHAPGASVNFGNVIAAVGAGGEAFNLYDQSVYGADYLAFLQGARPGSAQALTVLWQIDAGVSSSNTGTTVIQMRRHRGYDDTVFLHEFGHYA
jgi:hypothetical protein